MLLLLLLLAAVVVDVAVVGAAAVCCFTKTRKISRMITRSNRSYYERNTSFRYLVNAVS